MNSIAPGEELRVALFASLFHPHMGGVEEHVRQIAHAFESFGVRPLVVTNRWPRDLPLHEKFEEIAVYRPALRAPVGDWKARLNFYRTRSATLRQIADVLRENSIDIIHVHCIGPNAYYALQLQDTLQLPLVVTTHGERDMDATGLFDRSPFMDNVFRQSLARGDHLTACSQHTLDRTQKYFGAPFGARAQVVYNGVDAREFERLDDNTDQSTLIPSHPYIFAIGRHVPQKGFDVLLEAFARAELDDLDLVLAGDGPQRTMLEEQSRALNIGERVHFCGRAERADVVRLFRGCRFFVLPSRYEPMGIVNLEAMVCGKPVIASDVGGVPEVVHHEETGILVPPDDAAALCAALQRLAGNAALQEQLGAAGRERAGLFSWPAAAQSYLDIYQRVLAASSTRS